MLYKPTFCCQCGEKIERQKWSLWTSRRFCENCETDFRKEEFLIPGILICLTLTSGLLAFGSFFQSPEKPLLVTTRKNVRESSDNSAHNRENSKNQFSEANQNSVNNNSRIIALQKSSEIPVNSAKSPESQISADETVYFCGAQTKKGMPCSRKVKGSSRCWQHRGQPAMLPKNKLVAGR